MSLFGLIIKTYRARGSVPKGGGCFSYTGCASISHSMQCKQTIGWPTRKERDFVELFAVKVREQQVCISSENIKFIVLYNCSNNVHFYLVNWNIPSGLNFLCCYLKIHMVLCYWERVLQRFFFMYDYASNLRLYLHEISIISATMTPIDYHLTEQCSWCVSPSHFIYSTPFCMEEDIWDLVKSLKALISTVSSIF